MRGWFSRKGKAIGRFQDQQHPVASWVLRQQPRAALHTAQVHHFNLRQKGSHTLWTLSATWQLVLWIFHSSIYEEHIIHALVPFNCFQAHRQIQLWKETATYPWEGYKRCQSERQIRKTLFQQNRAKCSNIYWSRTSLDRIMHTFLLLGWHLSLIPFVNTVFLTEWHAGDLWESQPEKARPSAAIDSQHIGMDKARFWNNNENFFSLSLHVWPLYSWTSFQRGENWAPNISIQTCFSLPVINCMLYLNHIST